MRRFVAFPCCPAAGLILAAALFAAQSARAAEASQAERAAQVENIPRGTEAGLIANLQVGLGYTRMTSEHLTVQGAGTVVEARLGALVTPQLGFFGTFTECDSTAPSFYPNGAFHDDDPDVSLRISGVGAGAVYYWAPAWLYSALSVEMVWASLDEMGAAHHDEATRFRTSVGVAGTLTLGRDWWVGDRWAVGGAAFSQISYIPDQDDTTWANSTFGVTFSATYN